MAIWMLLEFLCKIYLGWARRSWLRKYAASHGYSFQKQDADRSIQFDWVAIFGESTEDNQFDPAINVMRGTISEVKFTYFEIVRVVASGFRARDQLGVRSIVAIDSRAAGAFATVPALRIDLIFYRDSGTILFCCSEAAGQKAIRKEKLDQWLADIASTFKVGAVTSV